MRFEPASQRLRCGACRGEQALDEPAAAALAQALAEQDYAHYLALRAGQEPEVAVQTVSCPQCGAHCEFPPRVVAMPCAFCATPLQATQGHAQRHLRPHALLPFLLDDGAARQAFARWVGSRWFAPNALKHLVRSPDGGRGVYLPAWTIDAHSHTEYRGERGRHRQLRETRQNAQGQSETVTRTVTDWTPVQGELELQFDDELIPASASLPAAGAPALAMPALDALRVLDGDFQAGFQTEAYTLGLEPAFAQAKTRFELRIEAAVRRQIGGDAQRIQALHSQFDAIRFRLILLPAWIYSYRFQGRVWQVVVNGHSGTVAGERPWSAWKIGLAGAGLALGAALLWWLGQGSSVS